MNVSGDDLFGIVENDLYVPNKISTKDNISFLKRNRNGHRRDV